MSNRLQTEFSRFTFYISRYKFLAVTLAIACVAAWPLLAEPGLLNTRGGGDSPFLLQRLQQLETAVLEGHFPVRWMPDANYGYGYPFFNYYAPLSVYITLVFRFIGFSYVRSIQLSQLAGFLVAAWGMLALGRRWFKSDLAGILAAAAYTIAPFHMVNVYVRGDSLAEFWAMAFYPLVILAADRLISRGAREQGRKGAGYSLQHPHPSAPPPHKSIIWLALAYTGLILSHNISALIFSPFLLLYILLRWRQSKLNCSLFIVHYSFSALLLALALSAWFFIPALAEQSLAQLGPVTEGYFHFSNHFRGSDLVQTGFFVDYNPDGGIAFRMGLVQAITAVLGLLILFSPNNPTTSSPVRFFITTSLLIATFMITPLSRPLWKNMPLLSFTQFPWRFLSVQAFAGALATAGLATLTWRKWLVPVAAVLLLVSGMGDLQTDHIDLTDADITAEKLAQYEWFTGNIGTTISAEYLPHTVQPRPYTSPWLTTGERDTVRTLSGELLTSQRTNNQTLHQIWQLETAVPTTLILPTMYWPGWMGEIDEERVEIRPSPGSGLIMLDVPAGSHAISLRLTRTPVRLAAELLSLAALLVVFWLLIKDKRLETRDWSFKVSRQSLVSSFLLIVMIIVLRLWPKSTPTTDDLTWDFAQIGYLHHDNGIHFNNGAVLTGYVIDREVVKAGETVTMTLNWLREAPARATLALATPAKLRLLDTDGTVLIEQTQPIQAGSTTYQLVVPQNAPPGLYVPRLLLDNGRALTSSGQTRGDLYLRPIRILPTTNSQQPPANSQLDVRVDQVSQREKVFDVQLAWWTAQQLSHNYNISLRLLNESGDVATQFDAQPGYGFLPSNGWPVNKWVNDWLTVPNPTTDSGPYALVATLYDATTGEVKLTRRLGALNGQLLFQKQEPNFDLPGDLAGSTAVFTVKDTSIIQLAGYKKQPDGLTLTWESLAATTSNYTRFVHVLDPTTGEMLTQVDGHAMSNSYPTSQWLPGEFIFDRIRLDWSTMPSDSAIWVGWYENLGNSFPRLAAVNSDRSPIPDDRVPLFIINGNP